MSRLGRIAEDLRSPLLRNAAYLNLNEIVGAGFGLAFWVLAARFLSTADVGLGTTFVSVGILLGIVATLGFTIALVRFVPNAGPRRDALIGTAVLFTLGASLLLSGAFLVTPSLWTSSLATLLDEPVEGALFAAFVAGWGVFIVMDAAFVGTGDAKPVFLRGAVTGVLKPVLLVVAISSNGGTLSIPLAWGLALWVSNMAGMGIAGRTGAFRAIPRGIDRGAARTMARYASGNHVVTLLGAGAGQLLPVLVLIQLGPESVAHFYIAWMVSNLLGLTPAAMQTAVLAESSKQEARTREHTLAGLRWTYAILVPVGAATVVLAPYILEVFSPDYAVASPLLRVLVLAIFLQALNGAYVTRLRVERRLGPLLAISATVLAVSLSAASTLMSAFALEGIGYGVLLGQAVGAAFSVWGLRDYRTGPPLPPAR